MIENPHFYAVIIGTEILNGRRVDKHFEFVKSALQTRGHELYAALTVKDSPALLRDIFTLIKNDPKAVMFSFGGIGSTPDDLTREIAAEIFTCKEVLQHEQFFNDILKRFGDEAYPHRIFMSHLPEGSQLLKNPVNNMSGFYLDERFFFVPGFPEMSHPMIEEALQRFYPHAHNDSYRKTLLAYTSENTLIDVMKTMHDAIELSSLPMFVNGAPRCEISVAGENEQQVTDAFDAFTSELKRLDIDFEIM